MLKIPSINIKLIHMEKNQDVQVLAIFSKALNTVPIFNMEHFLSSFFSFPPTFLEPSAAATAASVEDLGENEDESKERKTFLKTVK